jgi:hypothetical protein
VTLLSDAIVLTSISGNALKIFFNKLSGVGVTCALV